jgi:hypothetical protein
VTAAVGGGCPATPPWPSVLDAVGLAGGVSFQYVLPAWGIFFTAYYAGGTWNIRLQQSGVQDWSLVDGPLVWNPATFSWTGNAVRVKFGGDPCTQTLAIRWTPKVLMGEQPLHAPCDEKEPVSGDVWRWQHQSDMLPGHRYRSLHNGGRQLWPNKVRGMVKISGGWGPAADVIDRWVWFTVDPMTPPW